METSISNMVTSYERGALSRRQLIQGLAMLAATGTAASASAFSPAQAPTSVVGLQITAVDHVSVQVSDLQRSVKFYQDMFGLGFINEDKKNQTVRLRAGDGGCYIRQVKPAGVVDHFAFRVEAFDKAAVLADMKKYGVEPVQALQKGAGLGFHVLDPDGYPVQLIARGDHAG